MWLCCSEAKRETTDLRVKWKIDGTALEPHRQPRPQISKGLCGMWNTEGKKMLLKKRELGSLAIMGGILASACCTLPLLAVFLGVSLMSASGLALIANLRPLFVLSAVAAIGLFYYATFVNKKTCCAPDELGRQRTWFLIITGAVVLGITSPYWILLFQ